MSNKLKLFKKITCILGITFLVLGMVPLPLVSKIATAAASVVETKGKALGLPNLNLSGEETTANVVEGKISISPKGAASLFDRTSEQPPCVYGEWSACSVTCGNGIQTRTKTSGPGFCAESETQACNLGACTPTPVNCSGHWGDCSVTCGGGTQTFIVDVPAQNGGTECSPVGGTTQSCNTEACAPTCLPNGEACANDGDCCDGNCNGNKCKAVVSQCKGPGGPCGGNTDCCPGLVCFIGAGPENEKCTTPPPPDTNCVGSWSACVGNCGTGIQTYTVTVPQSGNGTQCEAANGATRSCVLPACAVDCVGAWTACDETCGGGSQTFVVTTPASNGGQACEFADQVTRECNTDPCPVDCAGHFEGCSAQCGAGTQTYVIDTPAQFGGAACAYEDGDQIPCNNGPCPVDCVGDWGLCEGNCGEVGIQTFAVTTPAANGGVACEFEDGETKDCEMPTCPLDCVGEWGECVGECGVDGVQTFTVLQAADPGGAACEAEDGATQACPGDPCPVDCQWSDWGACSAACGGGTQGRRIAVQAANGGAVCEGPSTRDCNTQACTPPPGGGGTPTGVIPVTGGAGGPTDPLIIPVTGLDLGLNLAGLQKLFMFMGLMLFGVTMMLEGFDRKRTK